MKNVGSVLNNREYFNTPATSGISDVHVWRED